MTIFNNKKNKLKNYIKLNPILHEKNSFLTFLSSHVHNTNFQFEKLLFFIFLVIYEWCRIDMGRKEGRNFNQQVLFYYKSVMNSAENFSVYGKIVYDKFNAMIFFWGSNENLKWKIFHLYLTTMIIFLDLIRFSVR